MGTAASEWYEAALGSTGLRMSDQQSAACLTPEFPDPISDSDLLAPCNIREKSARCARHCSPDLSQLRPTGLSAQCIHPGFAKACILAKNCPEATLGLLISPSADT